MTTAVPGLVPTEKIHAYINKLAAWLEDFKELDAKLSEMKAYESLVAAGLRPGSSGLRSAGSLAAEISREYRQFFTDVESAYYSSRRLESAIDGAQQAARHARRPA